VESSNSTEGEMRPLIEYLLASQVQLLMDSEKRVEAIQEDIRRIIVTIDPEAKMAKYIEIGGTHNGHLHYRLWDTHFAKTSKVIKYAIDSAKQ